MKVVIPHMGHLDIACRGALRNVGIDVVSPPRASNVSLKLGAKYSPELACLPFKINLGNFIDAINGGAKTIMTAGGCGPCRFGYYSILQERILQDMGYSFEMIRADEPDKLANLAKTLKEAMDSLLPFKIDLPRSTNVSSTVMPSPFTLKVGSSIGAASLNATLTISGRPKNFGQ